MKKFLSLIFIFFMSLSSVFADVEDKILPSQLGIVQKVEYVDTDNEVAQVKQVVDIKLLKGDLKGSLVQLDNMLTGNPYYDIKLKKGMKVILHVEESEDIAITEFSWSGEVFAILDIKIIAEYTKTTD